MTRSKGQAVQEAFTQVKCQSETTVNQKLRLKLTAPNTTINRVINKCGVGGERLIIIPSCTEDMYERLLLPEKKISVTKIIIPTINQFMLHNFDQKLNIIMHTCIHT